MLRNALIALVAVVAGTPQAVGQTTRPYALTETQRTAIVRHGPWPPAWSPDPTNSMSGKPEAAALGRLLFFDARLSPSGRFACSSCHRPERGWTDTPRRLSRGIGPTRFNTPTLMDVRHHSAFGWTGSNDSLWQQSLRPLLEPREMGSNPAHVRGHILGGRELKQTFQALAGFDPETAAPTAVIVGAAKALAAYQETIISPRTAFDELRDALATSDPVTAARYPGPAMDGLKLFVGRAGCVTCHAGPSFSDSRTHAVTSTASPPAQVVRTPTLRSLARTAPYLHDGRAVTISAAILAHRRRPALSPREITDLVQFIATLSPP